MRASTLAALLERAAILLAMLAANLPAILVPMAIRASVRADDSPAERGRQVKSGKRQKESGLEQLAVDEVRPGDLCKLVAARTL